MVDLKIREKVPKGSVNTENETIVLETQIHIQSFIPQNIPCKNLLTYLHFMTFMVTYRVMRDQHKLYKQLDILLVEDVEPIYLYASRMKWEINQKSLEFLELNEYLLVGLKTVSVKAFSFYFPFC